MIEHTPNWAYIFLVVLAVGASMRVAGMGMKMVSAVLRKVERS